MSHDHEALTPEQVITLREYLSARDIEHLAEKLLKQNTELRATIAELEEENANLRVVILQVNDRLDVMTDRINTLLACVQS